MVIFHSYVSLPEGSGRMTDDDDEDDWMMIETL